MAIGSGNLILTADYNPIQTIVANVLGTGASGYGQAVASRQLAADESITASDLQNLKSDLDKISFKQTNAASTAPSVLVGGQMTASDWATYTSQATTLQTNKFILSSSQAIETIGVDPTFTNWNGTLKHEVIVAFGTAAAARTYFNTGSTIKIIPSQTGFTSSMSKGGRWAAIFTTVTFNYANWAAIASSNRQIHIATDNGAYSGNIFRILARADAANLYLTITFEDNGLTGNVDGITTSKVSHYRAAGTYVSVAAPNVITTNSKTFPSPPIITAVTATSSSSATVAFIAPTTNGGSPITSYTATSIPSGITGTLNQAESGTITVNGLTASTTYKFTVTATNGLGNSTTSGLSSSISNVPNAPTIIAATATDATTAKVTFTAPASNGSPAITSYTATSSPGNITAILNQAKGGTFTLTGLTTGTEYTFTVTATNGLGYSTTSPASKKVTTFLVPANIVAPVISGRSTVGQTLTATTGTWTGVPIPAYTYQWQRNEVNINGARTSSYKLVIADTGADIRCVVNAANSAGNSSANSNIISAVPTTVPGIPTIVTATVTGTTTATIAFTAPGDNGGVDITSYTATASFYPSGSAAGITGTLSQAGNGTITMSGLTPGTAYIFNMRATNSVGTSAASATSNNIRTYLLPVNTAAPVISGTATVRQILTTTTGTWTGVPAPTYSYQWQRAGVNISGATSNTYTLVSADVGSTIRCVITATNAAGNNSVNSNATSAVTTVPGAPTISSARVISPTSVTVAFTAPASNGGAAITSYTASSIPGNITGTLNQAGDGTITVTGLTEGTNYTFTVTATNSVGTSAASAASNNISTPFAAPTYVSGLSISGTPYIDSILSVTTGIWTGSPTYTYQWQRSGFDIRGATSSTYTITNIDNSNILSCIVTGTNVGGTVSTTSASTATVTMRPPYDLADPVISGTATVGQTLILTSVGDWGGYPTSYSYQWQRAGVNISGATSNTYTLVSADAGKAIRCVVTATNTVGSGSVNSNVTGAVAAIVPSAPTINTATATSTTTATISYIAPASNGGAIITSYTATSTPSNITGTLSQAGSGTIIMSGLTPGTEYTFTVTATNSVGISAASASNSTTTYSVPVNTAAPVTSGTPTVRQTLTTTTGTWTGIPAPTYSYQWQRAGVNISGAINSTYILVNADAGADIRCVITATNAAGNSSANSNATSNVSAVIPSAPTIVTATATGTTTASILYKAPASNGGAAITSYTASSIPGNITGTLNQAGDGTIIVTGLTEDTEYTFTVRATNSVGASTASAASNNIITDTTPTVPNNKVAPAVSGTAIRGQTLTTTIGTWTKVPAPTYSYQWQRAGVNISGATSNTYTLVSADVGSTIRCVITATNILGTVSANSNTTSTVAAVVPGAPTISTATATGGTTASVTFTAPSDNGGAAITSYTASSSPGNITGTLNQANGGTITVTGLTTDTEYTFTVRATNSSGTSNVSTASNSIRTFAVPVNTAIPVISGSAVVGRVITASTGTWTGNPTRYTYQWQRSGANIGGATSSTYTLGSSDGGSTSIWCVVTAINAAGNTSVKTGIINYVLVPTAPGAVQNLIAESVSSQSATLSWEAPSSDGFSPITGYDISWYGWGSLGYGGSSGTARTTATTYTIPVNSGVSYSITVKAINAVNLGTPEQVSVNTPGDNPVTATISPSVANIKINDSITFTVYTANAAPGTTFYWMTDSGSFGVPFSQFGQRPGGYLDVNGGQGTLTLTAVNDQSLNAVPIVGTQAANIWIIPSALAPGVMSGWYTYASAQVNIRNP